MKLNPIVIILISKSFYEICVAGQSRDEAGKCAKCEAGTISDTFALWAANGLNTKLDCTACTAGN